MSRVYCALVHYPVRDRAGQTVTTAVTNLDVHDIARSARTFGLQRYYIVTPIEAQHALVERIIEHWTTGAGRRRIPERHEALALCAAVASLADVLGDIEAREGARPRVWATAARPLPGKPLTSFTAGREAIPQSHEPNLILFGTGYGLSDSVLTEADFLLQPIHGAGDYNHLSVRAAAAIVLDRLFGASERH
ncbi:MAG: RNA methyltransferase [Polyangiales bacterium]